MGSDPNKKSARTFQCRDVLWDTFEQMGRELECSVDYLINEAMKQYARQRSYPQAAGAPQSGWVRSSSGSSLPPPPSRVPSPPSPPRSPSAPPPQATPPRGGAPVAAAIALAPSVPQAPTTQPVLNQPPPPPPRTAPSGGQSYARNVPAPPRSMPPPLPRASSPVPEEPAPAPHTSNGAATRTKLSLVYQGEKLPITKERFIIGRGKQSSDLILKDPNVSRQHAMIEYQNGVYFMVDMGSTNGVEFNGQRVARKQIAEGDIFVICDHDLVFTYR